MGACLWVQNQAKEPQSQIAWACLLSTFPFHLFYLRLSQIASGPVRRAPLSIFNSLAVFPPLSGNPFLFLQSVASFNGRKCLTEEFLEQKNKLTCSTVWMSLDVFYHSDDNFMYVDLCNPLLHGGYPPFTLQ